MKPRPFDPEKDYDTVAAWWKGHAWRVPLPKSMFPTSGLIIDDVCAAWLYVTDSYLSFLGWPVGNPEQSPRVIDRGLEIVIKELQLMAVERGSPYLSAYTNKTGLLKLYDRIGFQRADRGLTHSLFIGQGE